MYSTALVDITILACVPVRCDDLPPIQAAAQRFHRIIMLIPPVRNPDGTTRAAKNVNCYLLPLLQDLQRLGPAYPYHDIARFHGILGSVPPDEIGMPSGLMLTL